MEAKIKVMWPQVNGHLAPPEEEGMTSPQSSGGSMALLKHCVQTSRLQNCDGINT